MVQQPNHVMDTALPVCKKRRLQLNKTTCLTMCITSLQDRKELYCLKREEWDQRKKNCIRSSPTQLLCDLSSILFSHLNQALLMFPLFSHSVFYLICKKRVRRCSEFYKYAEYEQANTIPYPRKSRGYIFPSFLS